MSIKNSWYDAEKTIILMQYTAPWTWDQYAESVRNVYAMADAQGVTADIIIYSLDRQMPQGNPLVLAKNLYRHPDEYDSLWVYVNSNPLVKTFVHIFEVLSPAHRDHSFFAESIEAAAQMIHERRMRKAANQ
ncbi:MAG: hypothetical protein SF162_12270 [bacterium]|nr:hypothetical protein [bacterium]